MNNELSTTQTVVIVLAIAAFVLLAGFSVHEKFNKDKDDRNEENDDDQPQSFV